MEKKEISVENEIVAIIKEREKEKLNRLQLEAKNIEERITVAKAGITLLRECELSSIRFRVKISVRGSGGTDKELNRFCKTGVSMEEAIKGAIRAYINETKEEVTLDQITVIARLSASAIDDYEVPQEIWAEYAREVGIEN